MFTVEFLWWWVGGWVGGGVSKVIFVQHNYSVEVVLCCRWGCDNTQLPFMKPSLKCICFSLAIWDQSTLFDYLERRRVKA